jgi:hypothetical protein
MIRNRVLAAFCLAAALPVAAHSQREPNATLRGAVSDSGARPIEGVEVFVPGSGRGVRSGDDGRFVLVHLMAGSARVQLRRIGFLPIDTLVHIDSAGTAELRVSMRRVAQELARVLVVAPSDCPSRTLEGFDCRRRAGVGVFRDSTDFAAIKPVWLADVLYGADGLRRVPYGKRGETDVKVESTTGWRCLTTLVDGRLPYEGESRTLRVEDFKAVEFYANWDDTPSWYKSIAFQEGGGTARRSPGRATMPGVKCALIVYWSKFAPRFDPRLDQGVEVTRAREARLNAQLRLLDSLKAADSVSRKKPQ